MNAALSVYSTVAAYILPAKLESFLSKIDEPMICPRCQSTEYYVLQGRKFVRCKRCKRDFSETSGTLWGHPKMRPEKRQAIIDLLEQGQNAHAISLRMGVQYKTVWAIKKKMEQEWTRGRVPREPTEFRVGDLVSRINIDGEVVAAFVTGFCSNEKFVRVRGDNGRTRIWKTDNLANDDDELRRLASLTAAVCG